MQKSSGTRPASDAPRGYILPDGPRAPFLWRILLASFDRTRSMSLEDRRQQYGQDFTLKLPLFGKSLVISDPDKIRQLFKADISELGNTEPNLGRVMGPGSLFALSGDAHRSQRKLLTPAFHGNRLAKYRELMAEEARAGMAAWPDGQSVASLPAMNAITLNIILRTVFGARGQDLDALRALLPRLVKLGSILAATPIPRWEFFGYAPWGRFNRMRDEYDAIVKRLIADARTDPALNNRNDILALLISARYDDGSAMTDRDIADELVTLLTAGHETTATTLAWAIERLRRHPDFMNRLVDDIDHGSDTLLTAFINEVQRTRPVIAFTFRKVLADGYAIGRWRVPAGMHIMIAIALVQTDPTLFTEPHRFWPERFLDDRPDPYELIPFGGGVRRCIGAAFAHMELEVVLRTLLTEHSLTPTDAPDEAWLSRGVAFAPGDGGQIVRHPRM